MGTSQSSGGPGAGVPMVPSWVDSPPPEAPSGDPPAEGEEAPGPPAAPPPPPQLAPDRRFLGVSRSLGEYAKTGDTRAMRRGFGHYARSGYGGARTAARRMGGTASTAGALGGALANLAAGASRHARQPARSGTARWSLGRRDYGCGRRGRSPGRWHPRRGGISCGYPRCSIRAPDPLSRRRPVKLGRRAA